jgi:ABC-type nickel/cobalt efflux system permease component RcnA
MLFLAVALGIPQPVLSPCFAHPVPRRSHDRTIVVRLSQDQDGAIQVRIDYRLEVDEFTVVFDDLPAVSDKVELSKLRQPDEFYQAYTACYSPILAANLIATLDGVPLEFQCVKRSHQLRDENGVPLNHLRCDFVFQARSKAPAQRASNQEHRFAFKEGNFELEEGLVRLSLVGERPIHLLSKVEPDSALQARPVTELGPGDDAKLRKAGAVFTTEESSQTPTLETPVTGASLEARSDKSANSLLRLLLDSQQGFLVLLLLAALFGAAHALTPGHGKTLVAVYLVGERGTVSHAFVLGLVTTLTHTGAVLALAVLLLFFFPRAVPGDVQVILGAVGGLLIAGMGFWLLLRRLSGGADHVHLGGPGHHHGHPHDHSHADHYHDKQGHVHPLRAASDAGGWWGLIILGVSGGIIPCWDAILMLGFAISAQRLWIGLPLLLAFSAGLAGVLILIGIGVVYLKSFASSHWGSGWLVRSLPLASAVLVAGMGLWLCYDSLHASGIR